MSALQSMNTGEDIAAATGGQVGTGDVDTARGIAAALRGVLASSLEVPQTADGAPVTGGDTTAVPSALDADMRLAGLPGLLALLQLDGSGDHDGAACADPAAVAALPRMVLRDPSVDLPRAWRLRVSVPSSTGGPQFSAEYAVVPSSFSGALPVPTATTSMDSGTATSGAPTPTANIADGLIGSVSGRLCAARPMDGSASPLQNAGAIRGAIALMTRGTVSFAVKALRAAAAGAVAVVCIQSADVWPYTATDSAGEVAASGAVAPPFVMMRQQEGAALRKALEGASGHEAPAAAAATAVLSSHASAAECSVCLEALSRGDTVVTLPCGHYFHEPCVVAGWLSRRSTCPLCRAPLPQAQVSTGAFAAAARSHRALADAESHRRAASSTWYS